MEFGEAISWFQAKIGTYDKASWERLVEERELRIYEGLHYVKKKTGSVKPELIDVDLVRGSTFTKAKPIHTWGAITRKGLLHVILFPFFYKWWQQQTSTRLWLWFLLLYIIQMISIVIYLTDTSPDIKEITASEVFGPAMVMIFLGSLHGHLVATNFSNKSSSPQRKLRNRRRNSKSRKKDKNCTEDLLDISDKNGIKISPPEDCALRHRTINHQQNSGYAENICNGHDAGCEDIPPHHHHDKLSPSESMSSEEKFNKILNSMNDDEYDKPTAEKYNERGTEDELSENGDSTSSMSSSSEAEQMDMSEDEDPFAFERKQEKLGESAAPPTAEKVTVAIWEGSQCKKAELTLVEISSAIVAKVDAMKFNIDYLHFGMMFSMLLAPLPLLFRLYNSNKINSWNIVTAASEILDFELFSLLFGTSMSCKFVVISAMIERFSLTFCYVFLLCVAERTFRQRFLYAKLFGCLTSLRKARRAGLPHFRLHKVRNIKTWLSLRSFLKKRGPQRSVEMIVSSSFLLVVFLTILMLTQLVKGTEKERFLNSMFNWEVSCWCLVLWLFEMRFMTLGSRINRKYSNSKSVLLIEQVNLYLQMEKSPHKKEEFNIANNVLKLAMDLLKEVESPFKLSGISMSSHLYNITRVVVLSLFSGVMSDLLGFRLRGLKVLKLS